MQLEQDSQSILSRLDTSPKTTEAAPACVLGKTKQNVDQRRVKPQGLHEADAGTAQFICDLGGFHVRMVLALGKCLTSSM